jgi:hypothetical protein
MHFKVYASFSLFNLHFAGRAREFKFTTQGRNILILPQLNTMSVEACWFANCKENRAIVSLFAEKWNVQNLCFVGRTLKVCIFNGKLWMPKFYIFGFQWPGSKIKAFLRLVFIRKDLIKTKLACIRQTWKSAYIFVTYSCIYQLYEYMRGSKCSTDNGELLSVEDFKILKIFLETLIVLKRFYSKKQWDWGKMVRIDV